MRTWLLPEYVEDILPAEAARIERLRRTILDLFAVHGYQLVMPPLLDSTTARKAVTVVFETNVPLPEYRVDMDGMVLS